MVLALGSGIACSCRGQAARSAGDASPQVTQGTGSSELAERWEQERAHLDKLSKSYPANQLTILESLLDKLPPEQVASEFERIRSTPVGFREMSDFDENLLQVFVIKATQQKDRTHLVYLLSGHCPRYIATDGIEFYLALSGMPDPLLILFDSYSKADKEVTRKELIAALSSVFRDLRREHPDDQQFVNASKEWYVKHGDKLKVNPYYQPDSNFSDSRDFFVNSSL
jgi:hypothetical protein